MRCDNCQFCPLALALRWAGRGLGLALFALVAWFLVAHVVAGEGPNPFQMGPAELGLLVTLFAAVAGMLLGWRWEVAGGALVMAGMLLFFAINRLGSGSWPGGWFVWVLPMPGVLYLLASAFDARRARHLGVPS
jgi:hypothetical protein